MYFLGGFLGDVFFSGGIGSESSRRALAALLILGLLLIGAREPAWAQEEDGPPNILLILADDLGYGDLSSYGAEDLRTPHIEALAEQGMRFDRFYANSPVCSPTRAALLTGRYPEMVGVPGVIRTHARNSWGYLREDAKMIGEVLHRAGYHTGMVGKWHLGFEAPNRPRDRSFDDTYVFLGDMMDDYYTHRRHGINYMRENGDVIDPEGHATDLFTRAAVEYIHERSGSEAPFFLYLAYNAPHSPIQPPEDWLDKVRAREPDMGTDRARLAALIEHMDAGVGRVVDAIKAAGEYENTLVVFVSDNGGAPYFAADNGRLRGGKQEMYEGGIRVPMIAAWPNHIAPDSRSQRKALTMDLFPTLAAAAGVSVDHYIEGRSILPTLLGEEQDFDQRPLFFTRREGNNRYMGKTIWAVRKGDWKLLQNTPTQPFELYNLDEDPREQNDLADQNEEKFNELAELLRRHIQQGGRVPWQE